MNIFFLTNNKTSEGFKTHGGDLAMLNIGRLDNERGRKKQFINNIQLQ